jgi:hypothetical protein
MNRALERNERQIQFRAYQVAETFVDRQSPPIWAGDPVVATKAKCAAEDAQILADIDDRIARDRHSCESDLTRRREHPDISKSVAGAQQGLLLSLPDSR